MKSVVLNGSSVEAVSLLLATVWIGPVPCLFRSVVRGLFGRLRGAVEEGLELYFWGLLVPAFGVFCLLPSASFLVAAGLWVLMFFPPFRWQYPQQWVYVIPSVVCSAASWQFSD